MNDATVSHDINEEAKQLVLHCEVHRWSKSTYLALLAELAAIREAYEGFTIFAPDIQDKKQTKFLTMMGFKWCQDIGVDQQDNIVNMWRLV